MLSFLFSYLGTSDMIFRASEVTVACLEFMALNFSLPESSCSREVATMIFPFLLVLPKVLFCLFIFKDFFSKFWCLHSFFYWQTWKVNLKALELAKDLKWQFYSDSFVSYSVPFQGEIKVIFFWGLLHVIASISLILFDLMIGNGFLDLHVKFIGKKLLILIYGPMN